VGFSWLSNDLADYYYGVRSDETKVGRPAYSAGSGVNWFAGLGTDYKLDEKWSLFAQFSYEWLNNEITDSPIVDDDYKITILAGAMYKY
jgi:outer membrane protein